MSKQKNNKGVTLVALILTIIIMLILVSTVVYNLSNRNTMTELDDLYNDLSLLEQRYKTYYAKNGDIPLENKYENIEEILAKIESVRNPNDDNEYYYIEDTEDITLNSKGTFVINKKTLTVYYLDGVAVNGKTYYTLPNEYTEVNVDNQALLTSISDGSWDNEKGVNAPLLLEGMTPVYWDDEGNEKLLTNIEQDDWDAWYNYNNNKWANAKTEDGSYWVWIPRFEYKIANPGTATESDIYVKFIPITQKEPDADYDYIHPAFTDGTNNVFKNGEWNEEIPGFWVAKYIAGFQASSLNNEGQLENESDEVVFSDILYTSFNKDYTTNALRQDLSESGYSSQKISYPVFKPLTYAYNNISIGDCYSISRQIAKANNVYGLNSKTVDSHLMKNSELGAVLYLTHSEFGRNKEQINSNQVNLGNSEKHIYGITGYAGSGLPTGGIAQPNATSASSTDNMSGVYDLESYNYELTSSYLTNGDTNLGIYAQSMTLYDVQTSEYQKKSNKYTTTYNVGNSDTNVENYNLYKHLKTDEKYGDALFETSEITNSNTAWFEGASIYPSDTLPFFARNMFGFQAINGAPNYKCSFRVILIGK